MNTPPSEPTQDQLRFVTCGSVDDGKSTLIGRLLYDSGLLYDDQLAALLKEGARRGRKADDPDFSLLLDGLLAEREQGITIDVAYRQFATAMRRFIVADAPGHEQYTPNMVTAASNCEAAVLLLDVRAGLLPQTRRHTRIITLLGIRSVILVVNKMDLVDYDEQRFAAVRDEFIPFAAELGATQIICIPASALRGDNVVHVSEKMPWYKGLPLLRQLEILPPPAEDESLPLRLPVQWINHPHADFRGASGTIVAGKVRVGDAVCVAGTGVHSKVKSIFRGDQEQEEAHSGAPVTLTFTDHIDVSRGHVLTSADAPLEVKDQLAADIIWMGSTNLLPGRSYLFKCGPTSGSATITALRWRFNIDTLSKDNATHLAFNEVGRCHISLSAPLAFEPYDSNRLLGGFILIDRLSNATVGAGLIRHGLRRADNLTWHQFSVDKTSRSHLKSQVPCLIWFTGLPASGKSTVADRLEAKLLSMGKHTYCLDGDNMRHGLNRDLGFTPEDRVENIRRVGEVAKLMLDAGLIVLATFISPYRNERQMARELLKPAEFIECYVDTSLDVCRQRDPKGLYRRADLGALPNLTGVGAPYEAPESPELILQGGAKSPDALADEVLDFLLHRGLLTGKK